MLIWIKLLWLQIVLVDYLRYIQKYNVKIVSLKILYKTKEYIDGINITPEEVYAKLPDELPTTSMPSVDDVSILYDELVRDGYTHAIVLPVSSGLSGNYK